MLAGFRNRKVGALGVLESTLTALCTVTIIPFMPNRWEASAGGFPAKVGNMAFLMKVLPAISVYLLKQDLARTLLARTAASGRELPRTAATLARSAPFHSG